MDAENNFIKEFILCYETKRCLWDITSPEYLLRDVKNSAYDDLLKIMKKYKKQCSVEDVKKKINIIRSSYRRELKKIKKSESSGAGVCNLYQPKIWWFDCCQFLRNCEQPTGGVTTLSDEETLHNASSSEPTNGDSVTEPPNKIKKSNKENHAVDVALSYLQKKTDAFEHLGLAWAAKVKKMEPRQSKLAERLISEVIFQGDMEMLTLDTTVQIRTPRSAETSSSYSRSSTPHNFADRHFRTICQQQQRANSNTYSTPSAPQYVLSPPPTQTMFLSSFEESNSKMEQLEENIEPNSIIEFINNFEE